MLRFLGEIWGGWHRHRCSQIGAALAFYGVFSLAPLLILFASIFGFVLASWTGAPAFREGMAQLFAEGVSPQFSRIAIGALAATEAAKEQLGLIALGTLLLTSAGAFAQLEMALQVVWDVHTPQRSVPFRKQVIGFLRTRLVSFLLVAGAAILVLASLLGDLFLDTFARRLFAERPATLRLAELGVGFVAAGFVVALLYRLVPSRTVPWHAAMVGGFLTAGLWEGAKQVLNLVLARSDYANAYPILGSALAVLIWVYLAGLVFLLGAEVAAALTRMSAGEEE